MTNIFFVFLIIIYYSIFTDKPLEIIVVTRQKVIIAITFQIHKGQFNSNGLLCVFNSSKKRMKKQLD